MKKNEEEVRNNNAVENGEEVDQKITAIYEKDTDAENGEAEDEEESEEADEEEDDEIDKEDAKEARKILKEKGLIQFASEVCSSIPKANKGISGKKLYDSYINEWIAGIFATLVTVFKVWLNAKQALTEKQVIKMQNILQEILQNSQNTTLGIISGFRFQSNLNIFQVGWNWLCSKFEWGWMHMVDEFTIFKKSEAPYNSEEINNNLDEYNCKIYDFIRIWNRQYPEYKVNIKQQDKIDKFDPKTFNNLIWFFNEEADKGKEIVCFSRKFYTNFAKKIDNYCFCKGVKVAGIVFGCVIIGGVGYAIYAFGWDGFISKISEILNTKSESNTEESKDELFNTEEVEYLC